MISTKTFFMSVILASVLMTGCGNSTEPSTQIDKALLKGVAVDDLIVNGKVKAYDPANLSVILAEGRTDKDDGSYVLHVAHEGVVVVEVTCDDKSQMKNPVTKELKVCEQNMKLHSAAALSADKKEVIVNISPISELVVRQMEDKGISKKNLEAAQSNIGQMFGFDPLGENPVTNDQYAKVIDAVHQLAEEETDKSILEVVEKLSEDLVDGEAGDDGDIAQKFAEAMVAVGANNNLTESHGRYKPEEAATGSSSGGSTSGGSTSGGSTSGGSTSGGSTSPTDIEISKQFFNELRTQAMSLTDYQNSGTPGFLDTEAQKLGQTLENITINTKTAGDYAAGIITNIVHLIAQEDDAGEKEIDSHRSIVYKKESALVWSYEIIENEVKKYEGNVTLPVEKPDNISMPDFNGTLQVKFDGTLPLEEDTITRAVVQNTQTLQADITLMKKKYGADFALNNVSLESAGSKIALEDIVLKAYYGFDAEDELKMEHILFESASVSAQAGSYNLNGKLEVPEYVQNNILKDTGFMTEEYRTSVHGNIVCLTEHNERISQIKNAEVIYTDLKGNQHPINLSDWGYFWADIEGNVENLDPNDHNRGATVVSNSNWDNYVGLKFDNLTIKSDNCDNIKLENLSISIDKDKNQTAVSGNAFCVKDHQRTAIDGGTVVYKDKHGIEHDEPVEESKGTNFDRNFFIAFSGSDEIEELNVGEMQVTYKINAESGVKVVDFDRIHIEDTGCTTPALQNLFIETIKDENDAFHTFINGSAICLDDGNIGEISNGSVITYTDKDGIRHMLDSYKGNFDDKVTGNVEHLPLIKSRQDYAAAGMIQVNTTKTDRIEVHADNCPNPVLTYLDFYLDSDESFTNSGYLPKKVNFDGNISNSADSSMIAGHLEVDWLNATTIDLTGDGQTVVAVTLTGKIKIPERPVMLLNLGFTNNNNQNNFSFGYLYDATTISGTGAFDHEMDNGEIVLTTHNGLHATIKVENGDIVYGAQSSISRNGTTIGQLEERSGVPVIVYTDNTFESLP